MRKVESLKLGIKTHQRLKEIYKEIYGTDLGKVKNVFGIFGDVNLLSGTISTIFLDEKECTEFNEIIKEYLK